MDVAINNFNIIDNNLDSSMEKVLKCFTELQLLRKENTMLKMELTNAKLDKEYLDCEVDKLRQISQDLKCQINTAYSVINGFNKEHAERNSIFSHQLVKFEALKAENSFFTEQTFKLKENISKLSMDNFELLAKCQRLENNAATFNEKYNSACEFLQSLDNEVKNLVINQNNLKTIAEKTVIDINRVNHSVQLYRSDNNFLKQENQTMREKITELLLRFPIGSSVFSSLTEECDKLSSALIHEKLMNLKLISNLALCVSNQNQLYKSIGEVCDKSEQTET